MSRDCLSERKKGTDLPRDLAIADGGQAGAEGVAEAAVAEIADQHEPTDVRVAEQGQRGVAHVVVQRGRERDPLEQREGQHAHQLHHSHQPQKKERADTPLVHADTPHHRWMHTCTMASSRLCSLIPSALSSLLVSALFSVML